MASPSHPVFPSPSHPVFPSPPTSWPLPPPPPSSPPSASPNLFMLELQKFRLLQRALRSLVLTADTSLSNFCISPGVSITRQLLVARSNLPPHVDTCLAIPLCTFSDFDVPEPRVLRLNLRLLDAEMARTGGHDGARAEGSTLRFTAGKIGELIYSLRRENDEGESSVILISYSSYTGYLNDPDSYWWSEYGFTLSFRISSQFMNQVINRLNGSQVYITITQTEISFRGDNEEIRLSSEDNEYWLLDVYQLERCPYHIKFSLQQSVDAILNAVAMSDHVKFHQCDSGCVLGIPVGGLGDIYFRFNV